MGCTPSVCGRKEHLGLPRMIGITHADKMKNEEHQDSYDLGHLQTLRGDADPTAPTPHRDAEPHTQTIQGETFPPVKMPQGDMDTPVQTIQEKGSHQDTGPPPQRLHSPQHVFHTEDKIERADSVTHVISLRPELADEERNTADNQLQVNPPLHSHTTTLRDMVNATVSTRNLQSADSGGRWATRVDGFNVKAPLVVSGLTPTIQGSAFIEDDSRDLESISSAGEGVFEPTAIIKRAPNRKRSDSLTKCATGSSSREIHILHPSKQVSNDTSITSPLPSKTADKPSPDSQLTFQPPLRTQSSPDRKHIEEDTMSVQKSRKRHGGHKKKEHITADIRPTLNTVEEKESEESLPTKEAPGAPEPESGPQDKAGVQNSEKQTTDDQEKPLSPQPLGPYGYGLCVRVLKSREASESAVQIESEGRVSVTPSQQSDVPEAVATHSYAKKDEKSICSAAVVQEIEATEGLCETVTLTTAGNKAIRTPLITSLPLETPDVTKHKTLPVEKSTERCIRLRRLPAVQCYVAENTPDERRLPNINQVEDAIDPMITQTFHTYTCHQACTADVADSADKQHRADSAMSNRSEALSELVKLKSTSTLHPIPGNTNSNNPRNCNTSELIDLLHTVIQVEEAPTPNATTPKTTPQGFHSDEIGESKPGEKESHVLPQSDSNRSVMGSAHSHDQQPDRLNVFNRQEVYIVASDDSSNDGDNQAGKTTIKSATYSPNFKAKEKSATPLPSTSVPLYPLPVNPSSTTPVYPLPEVSVNETKSESAVTIPIEKPIFGQASASWTSHR